MRTRSPRLIGFALTVLTGIVHAQNDGDHLITNPGGQTSLATDIQVPVAPVNLTVGTTPGLGATLRVRGDELPIGAQHGGGLCTFRTDVAQQIQQSWWMYRDANEVGRVWNDATHLTFHFQSMRDGDVGQDRYSGVMMQNRLGNGLWVAQDGPMEGSRAFPNAAQVLNRTDGYAALGAREEWLAINGGLTDIRGPWSRFHLFHNNEPNGTVPYFGFRPQMRNGIRAPLTSAD